MTIEELIERSHAMAVERGWWPEGGRSVADQVNNFHSEISEAWEEYRAGRMDLWFCSDNGKFSADWAMELIRDDPAKWTPVLKPEGFWIEIADLCIRLADTMGAYGWTYSGLRKTDYAQMSCCNWDLPRLISTLHICVGCLAIDSDGEIGIGWEDGAQRSASGTICLCLLSASYHNINLLSICELKMTYNATRPIRHGGKRA